MEQVLNSFQEEGTVYITQNNRVHEFKGPLFNVGNETIWGFTARIIIYTFDELEKQLS